MVQIAGKYILGAADSHWFGASEKPNTAVDSYFLLDTAAGKHTVFSANDKLRRAGLQLGIRLNLEDIDVVYSRYRFTWFETFAAALLFVPLLVCFALLVSQILRLRPARSRSFCMKRVTPVH